MSLRLDLFNDIVTALENAATVNTIEFHNSQFDNEADERVHSYPMVTIEFSDMVWTTTRQQATGSNATNEQQGEFLVTLHIGYQTLKDETVSFPDMDAVITDVYNNVNMLSGNEYTPLQRVSEEQDIDHDGVIVWNMTFSSTVNECGSVGDKEDATDGGATDIALELTKDLDIDSQIIRSGDGTF